MYDPLFGATMPPQPPIPPGFQRWPPGRKVSKIARAMAVKYLKVVPMGGHVTAKDTDGTIIAAFKDWHFDNHPDLTRQAFWHPGISMLVSTQGKRLTSADIPMLPLSRYGNDW
jgi:hypothetical protein